MNRRRMNRRRVVHRSGAAVLVLALTLGCAQPSELDASAAVPDAPVWFEDAVIYHVFLDRFAGVENRRPSEEGLIGRLGGDLDGLADRLDHIVAVGADTVWLSPVHPSPANHGYHPTDLIGVEPLLGGRAALDRVMAEAEARGLRVVLDLVVSHTSDQHPWFQAARADCDSPFVAWYRFRSCPDDYAGFAGLRELPQLDLDHPEARAHVLDVVLPYWLDDVGVHGFRLDHVLGPSRDFWSELRRTVDERWPGTLLLGEVWADQRTIDSYIGTFDAATAFPLRDRLVAVFAAGGDVRALDHQLGLMAQRPGPIPATYLSSHDQPRFTHLAGDDTGRTGLAHVALLTLPGIPVLYYGDEVGMTQRADHTRYATYADRFFREPMEWDPSRWDEGLLATVADVASLRTRTPALSRGTYRSVVDRGDLIVFERTLGTQRILVIVANTPRRHADVDLGAIGPSPLDEDLRLRPLLPAPAPPSRWGRLTGARTADLRPSSGSLIVPLEDPGFAVLEIVDGHLPSR
jgi:cyclomaltodextrinase / maltogenic alpha-amylase / neopullulanase